MNKKQFCYTANGEERPIAYFWSNSQGDITYELLNIPSITGVHERQYLRNTCEGIKATVNSSNAMEILRILLECQEKNYHVIFGVNPSEQS